MTTIGSTKEAIAAARTRMEKAVDDFRKDLSTVRTGRANAALLDNVRVDFYGTPTPVNQVGTVTVPEPTMLVISPWDPSVVALVDKAIRASDLGSIQRMTAKWCAFRFRRRPKNAAKTL